MKHLISPLDLSVEELDQLLDLAQDIEANPKKYAHACDGKKLATLFYEPSTRTRLSHEAAMLNLGGSVMGFSSADSSSASKGESVSDTIRVISCYADICAMRHPKEGAPIVASQYSTIPIINAGDGGHQHPTQTLTDLLTIRNLKGRLNNMTIGLCGDLKFGRTVHSLINALVRYEGIRFVLISPEELRLPEYIRQDVLDRQQIPYEEVVRLEDALPKLDILYMTRVQKERFFNEEDYVLDTIAQYPNDPTLGKLTFMIDLKNQQKDQNVADFNGVGKSKLTMSLGYKDGNYPSESQVPIYTSQDVTAKYAVKLRLKGELLVSGDEWMIDYVYAQLASLFQPYPPANFPEVFMCKGGMKLGTFDSFRRTCTFDITYDRSDLSFSQLYFNLFINLAGQKRENRVRLRIDKESYFELYEQSEEM